MKIMVSFVLAFFLTISFLVVPIFAQEMNISEMNEILPTELSTEDEDISSAFTDANFLAAVRAVIGVNSEPIYASQLNNITVLNVSNKSIKNLDGIAYFTRLTSLSCDRNQLMALDVSKNPALTSLDCANNQLTALDVSSNPALKSLNCRYNQLTALDMSGNPALTSLDCYYNQLTALNVLNNPALTSLNCERNQLTALNVSNNPALISLNCCYNQLTALDVSNNPALTRFDCDNNQLAALDLSKNTALVILCCSRNQLTQLDLAYNTKLMSISCGHNPLTTLDVSNNIELSTLYCSSGRLKSLDLSKNTALTYLDCQDNWLTDLNISPNTKLKHLLCYSNYMGQEPNQSIPSWQKVWNYVGSLNNWDLEGFVYFPQYDTTLVQVTATINAISGGGTVNGGGSYTLGDIATLTATPHKGYIFDGWYEYGNKKISNAGAEYSFMVTAERILEARFIGGNEEDDEEEDNEDISGAFSDANFLAAVRAIIGIDDGPIYRKQLKNIAYLTVPNKGIESLDGIEYFTGLRNLTCSYNRLTALDVSKNTALESLWCHDNQITTLDMSSNLALKDLHCNNNQLTTLDVSKNTALIGIGCDNNKLTTLDVSNNPALTLLFCSHNQLTTLDVSNNPALTTFYCYYNQITTLNVSNNPELTVLQCQENRLTALDVSSNVALKELSCFNNQLTALDVSNSPALTYLHCSINQLTTLNISDNPALTKLYCHNNRLTYLDISRNPKLENLICAQNNMLQNPNQSVPNWQSLWSSAGDYDKHEFLGFVYFPQYESTQIIQITADVNDISRGSVQGSGIYSPGERVGRYSPGETVTLAAIPYEPYTFDGWYENGERIPSAEMIYTFTAEETRILEVRFTTQAPPTYTINTPTDIIINGVTAAVTHTPNIPQRAGTLITITVTLQGIPAKSGNFTFGLTSAKAGLIDLPQIIPVESGKVISDIAAYSFTMPDENINDLKLIFTFTETVIIDNTVAFDGSAWQIPASGGKNFCFSLDGWLVEKVYADNAHNAFLQWTKYTPEITLYSDIPPFTAIVRLTDFNGQIRYVGIEKPVSVSEGTTFDGKTWVVPSAHITEAVISFRDWRIEKLWCEAKDIISIMDANTVCISSAAEPFDAIIKVTKADGSVQYIEIERK